nr:hypothetical protein [Sphingopyxis sp. BSNA05]
MRNLPVGRAEPEREKALEHCTGNVGDGSHGENFREVRYAGVFLRRKISAVHIYIRKLPDLRLAMMYNDDPAVPLVLNDMIHPVFDGSPLSLDALHEVEPIANKQASQAKSFAIPPGNVRDRKKILLIHAGLYGAHKNERGDRTRRHAKLSHGGYLHSRDIARRDR